MNLLRKFDYEEKEIITLLKNTKKLLKTFSNDETLYAFNIRLIKSALDGYSGEKKKYFFKNLVKFKYHIKKI